MQVQRDNPLIYRALVIPFILGLAVFSILERAEGNQERQRQGAPASAQNASGSEMKAFRDGRELLQEEKWARAAERFNDYISDYPKSANVDAALYWLAFALKKQERFNEADRALKRLTNEFPSSTWADDAKTLRIEIAPYLGNTELISAGANAANNDESKLVALRNLFATNPEQATAISGNVFLPGSQASMSFKESTITMLGRYGGKQARHLLVEIARGDSDSRLRKTAIYWLGKEEDATILATLKDLALSSSDTNVGLAALSALLHQGSPAALAAFEDIARAAVSQDVRKRAETLLRTDTGASGTLKKNSWLLLKGNNELLLIPNGRVIKLSGSGALLFKGDGQRIEVPNGLSITVNGVTPFREGDVRRNETVDLVGGEIAARERLVEENETVRLVADGQRTIWELSVLPADSTNMLESGNWVNINGEFRVSAVEQKTFLLYAKPGEGVKFR
jgi:tetratricopeptide (TPR) repeat protein